MTVEITQEHVRVFNDGRALRNILRPEVEELGAIPDLSKLRVERIVASDVLQRLQDPLRFMEELWELASPSAYLAMTVPHGAAEVAWEDPRNLRPVFPGSFGVFSAPAHENKPELLYSADWRIESITFAVPEVIIAGRQLPEVMADAMKYRNQIVRMTALMVAVKPARPQKLELLEQPTLEVEQV